MAVTLVSAAVFTGCKTNDEQASTPYDWVGFYVNLQENAKARIDAYMADHK